MFNQHCITYFGKFLNNFTIRCRTLKQSTDISYYNSEKTNITIFIKNVNKLTVAFTCLVGFGTDTIRSLML